MGKNGTRQSGNNSLDNKPKDDKRSTGAQPQPSKDGQKDPSPSSQKHGGRVGDSSLDRK